MEDKIMYEFLRWNGKYGNNAKFIVLNTENKKQALFSPVNPKDITWVSDDLTKDSEFKGWEDFGHEKVDDLNDVVF
jgi:hypothetical protein